MILRKPYALLIKYFRLIHLVLTILMSYLIIRTNSLLSFFNELVLNPNFIQGYDISRELFNGWMFAFSIIIVLASFTVLSLMYFKKKPVLSYLFNILVYISLGVLYYISLNNVDILELRLLDIRIIRAIRDFLVGAMALQTLTLMFTFVRATGFDIKKFNFKEDLDELEINEEDREEFEVEFSLDTDKVLRFYNRKIRHFKYVYLENKFIINLFSIVFLIGFLTYSLINVFVLNKSYKETILFKTEDHGIRVNKSYTTQEDYRGNKILDKTKLVIIDLDIKNNYDVMQKIDTVMTELVVGKKHFKPTSKYNKKIDDIGTVYTEQFITKEFSNYIFAYEVPLDLNLDKAKFVYSEQVYKDNGIITKQYKVELEPYDLDRKETIVNLNLNDEVDLSNTVLKKGKLKFEKLETSYMKTIYYNFCLNKDECYPSVELLLPNILTNYTRGILEVKGTLTTDKEENLYDFIKKYSRITFGKDTGTKIFDEYKLVAPKKVKLNSTYFIEIPEEALILLDARMEIAIRDKVFIIKIPIMQYFG